MEKLKGSVSQVQQGQRKAYERQGVDISLTKAQRREPHVVRMGAEIDGIRGTLSSPKVKKLEIDSSALAWHH